MVVESSMEHNQPTNQHTTANL